MKNDIYGMSPVNKTARIVTGQSGCDDDFLTRNKEELKILGERKAQLMRICVDLKKEIGIDAREGTGRKTKYPPKILRHKKFKMLMGVRDNLRELDAEIKALKNRIPKGEHICSEKFVIIVKKQYPEIFETVKEIIFKEGAK